LRRDVVYAAGQVHMQGEQQENDRCDRPNQDRSGGERSGRG
jgi:hypothetical protein